MAVSRSPGSSVMDRPAGLSVEAEYGLMALQTADPPAAPPFMTCTLSAQKQAVLAHHGFDAARAPH